MLRYTGCSATSVTCGSTLSALGSSHIWSRRNSAAGHSLFLDALASLRSKLRPTERVSNQTQIAKITTESISDNEIGLYQYHKYQC